MTTAVATCFRAVWRGTPKENRQRCQAVAEEIIGENGTSLMFSLNLYSVEQDLMTQCREIDDIYQEMGLPAGS